MAHSGGSPLASSEDPPLASSKDSFSASSEDPPLTSSEVPPLASSEDSASASSEDLLLASSEDLPLASSEDLPLTSTGGLPLTSTRGLPLVSSGFFPLISSASASSVSSALISSAGASSASSALISSAGASSASSASPPLYSRLYTIDTLLEAEDEEDDPMRYFYTSISNKTNEADLLRRPKKKSVSVQTDHKVEAVYVPWIKEIEKKTDEFCTELNNILNSFYNSFKEETQRTVGDRKKTIKKELQKHGFYDLLDRESMHTIPYTDEEMAYSNIAAASAKVKNVFTDMEGRLKTVLKKANTVLYSIPVDTEIPTKIEVGTQAGVSSMAENVDEASPSLSADFSSHNLKQCVPQTQRSETEPFSAHMKPEKINKRRFALQKPLQIQEKAAVGHSERPKNFTGKKTSPPANIPGVHEQEQPLTDYEIARSQGAIPKRRNNKNVPATRKNEESSRNSKSNKNITQKPRWR